AHFRHARPCGHAGQADDYRYDERGELLPAAPAGSFDQFAVLDGEKYGLEVLSDDSVPTVPADWCAGAIRIVERVRRFSKPAGKAELHRQREKDLVGRASAPHVRHTGISHV